MSDSPLQTMLEAAIAIHEVYLSYVEAGFTDAQALELVKTLIANGGSGGA